MVRGGGHLKNHSFNRPTSTVGVPRTSRLNSSSFSLSIKMQRFSSRVAGSSVIKLLTPSLPLNESRPIAASTFYGNYFELKLLMKFIFTRLFIRLAVAKTSTFHPHQRFTPQCGGVQMTSLVLAAINNHVSLKSMCAS